MRFVCEKCRTKYSIADEKVRNKVLKIRCKKCQNIIVVREPAARPKAKQVPVERKRDKLDAEFERAFDRLTDDEDPGKPKGRKAAKSAKTSTRRDPGLDKEFGETPAEDEWFAILRGEQVGPMSIEELRQAVKEERVVHGTYVWHEGMDDWVRAARCPDVKEFLPDRRIVPAGAPAKGAPAKGAPAKADQEPEEKTRLISPEQATAAAAELASKSKAKAKAEVEAEPAAKPAAEPALKSVPEKAADPTPPRAQASAEGAADWSPAEGADEPEPEEDRRLEEAPGLPPPMPEDDDEIILAPAITGRLVTLRAAVAMCVASFVVASIGTAVLMAVFNPPVVQKVAAAPEKKKNKRKKIVLTPELLALKSQLFGTETGSKTGGRKTSRRSGKRKASGSGSTGLADMTGALAADAGGSPAGLEAAFRGGAVGVEEGRSSRGMDSTATTAALATSGAATGEVGLTASRRSSAAVDGGMDLDRGRRSSASLDQADKGPLPDGLSGETIAARFQGRWIESCYNRALKRDPGMKGKMIVSFELANNGRATDFEITPAKFRGTFLAQCFEREVRKLRFPRFRGETIPIEYPFILSAH